METLGRARESTTEFESLSMPKVRLVSHLGASFAPRKPESLAGTHG